MGAFLPPASPAKLSSSVTAEQEDWMKKRVKKLVLAKETVRDLAALEGVHGGDDTTFGPPPAPTETCTCITFCCASRVYNCFYVPPTN
jgi:hypothetical protein